MNIERICPNCMKEKGDGDKFCPYCGFQNDSETKFSPHVLKPFTILQGKYLVGNVLGEGGFGITYMGLDLNLEIRIAIKEFYPNGFVTRESEVTSMVTNYTRSDSGQYEKWRDSFVREARSLARFSNLPGIVHVRDFFQENNTAYIVMEFVEGETLKNYLKRYGGRIPVDDTLSMMKPVIQALSKVHEAQIIHRDISPDNIMVQEDGQVKLIDFGAARDFGTADEKSMSVLLKPGFAPEEQYRSRGNQGPWTDVYALCATIYRCITGEKPPESMDRMREDILKRPSSFGIQISPSVEAALLAGLEVYAEKRIKTMSELSAKLYDNGSVFTPEPHQTVRQPQIDNAVPVKADSNKKNRIIILISGVAVVGAVAVLLIFLVLKNSGSSDGSESTSGYANNSTQAAIQPAVENTDNNPADEGAAMTESTEEAPAETEERTTKEDRITEADSDHDRKEEQTSMYAWDEEDSYLLLYADSMVYPRSFFEDMSDEELRVARNELYARHGRMFKSEDLQMYFYSKSWYRPQYTPEEFDSMQEYIFNDYEKANRDLISSVEAERK